MRHVKVSLSRYIKFLHMASKLENEIDGLDLEVDLGLNVILDVHPQDFPDDLEELFKLLDGPYRAVILEMYKIKRRNNGKENYSQNEKGQGKQTGSEFSET